MKKFEIDDMKETFDFRKDFSDVNNTRINQLKRITQELQRRGITPKMAMIERNIKIIETPLGFEVHETFEVKDKKERKNG